MRISAPYRRVSLALAAATAIAASSVAVLGTGLAPAAQAAAGCRVDYQANQWTGGFTAAVKVTAGDVAVNGWTVTWTYGGDQRITNGWNAQVTQSGATVTARNAAWNGSLPAGGSTEFGVQGTYSASSAAPSGFTLNGELCNGAEPTTPPSTAPPTSQPPTTPPTSVPPTITPPPTVPPTTQPPSGCGTAVLCDGFENQTGSTPSGDWAVSYPDCSGSGTASIDTSVAHQGTRSVRINGAVGYCNHVFVGSTRNLSGVGAVRYARLWVRHTTALPTSHVTFLAMRDAADGNRDLRMGGQNGALQWNRASDDATLPEQSPNGVALSMPLPVNQWSCLEFMVDGTQGRLSTWVNGTAVTGLTADGTPTHDVDGQWYNRADWRPNLTDLRLGWESYGEGADTLWFDDVALGSSRIGC
ncbi:cellulose-binding domain-containing protein [Micromonospora sp. WMMD1102]|uniref:cellulose-binding domain-containing protein n=1 Tax=Micromonospora sp. WMMD1102 TaxID=3016105 RepID=UPI0024158F48|nr:cellulose-binding domain-containing protein [Micromonospora sp. WMMD1102]MDG4789055.1 cellulose-binding domain-containing protein [Micromonospora sp. WMMD1102]